MKILVISEDQRTINTPVHTVLADKGVEFRHVALAGLRTPGGPAFSRKLRRYFPAADVTRPVAEAVERFGPDLIHIGSGRTVGLAALRALRHRPNIPLLFDHGAIGGLNIFSPYEWQTYFNRRIDGIVVPSHALVNNWMGRAGLRRCIGPQRCNVLYHALPLPERISPADQDALRARLGLATGDFVVGTACSIRPIKNLPFVADIVRRLDDKTVFAVAGKARSADDRRRLEEAGGGRLRLLGPIADASTIMPAFDLFVTPTRPPGESFGLAPAEAMSHAVPVLAMNFGGTAEIFEHGISGLALPQKSGFWRDAITSLSSDAARRTRMGEAARERIKQRFSPEAIAADCLDLYERTIFARRS